LIMETLFFTLLGGSLLLLVAHDAYVTILHSRGRNGPLSRLLCRGVWRAATAISFKLSRTRRHRFLNSIGPLLMPTLLGLYITTLIIGFALIYYPRMPESFLVVREAASSDLTESLYFSGVTLTTVGYGDLVPRTSAMRILVIIEASSGLALISLAISYLVAVYRALEHKRTVALAFYHQAEGGADVVGFLTNHFAAGRLSGLAANLRAEARDLEEILESHNEHPVIHFFHPVEVYKGLPRVLFLSLEICAVIRSCLDKFEYEEINERPEVRGLESSARHVLSEFITALKLEKTVAESPGSFAEESRRWALRFRQTLDRLGEAGIKTKSGVEEGWETYRSHRDEWEHPLFALASYLGYDWDEVTGDRDLLYAADEQMSEPRVTASR
jgi:hypothetical protein